MNFKVYFKDAASYLEAHILGLELTSSYVESMYVVNPKSIGVAGKTIIINLPLELDYNRLSKFNNIISRFPIDCDNYELKPYEVGNLNLELTEVEYTFILTKELLSTLDHLNLIVKSRFLWGLDPITRGHYNLVGYLINYYNNKF